MDFNTLWAQIEPYIIMVATALTGGTAAILGVKSIAKGIISKLNVNAIIKRVTDGVVTALIGGELNIDLTALTGDRLKELVDKITDELIKKIEEQSTKLDTVAKLSVSTADVIASLKSASPEQKERIKTNSEAIRIEPPAPAKSVTKIRIEPIKRADKHKTDTGISMG